MKPFKEIVIPMSWANRILRLPEETGTEIGIYGKFANTTEVIPGSIDQNSNGVLEIDTEWANIKHRFLAADAEIIDVSKYDNLAVWNIGNLFAQGLAMMAKGGEECLNCQHYVNAISSRMFSSIITANQVRQGMGAQIEFSPLDKSGFDWRTFAKFGAIAGIIIFIMWGLQSGLFTGFFEWIGAQTQGMF